jgi:hypothetical protein
MRADKGPVRNAMDADNQLPAHTSAAVNLPALSAVNRRTLLKGAALLGGFAFLQGCSSRRLASNFPQPTWPDQQVAEPTPIYTAPRPTVIAQQPPQPQQPQVIQSRLTILPRAAWTREQPKMQHSKPMNGVSRITVHHDALAIDGRGQSWAVNRLNKIRRSHLDRGPTWVDIGYHYIIDPDGRVWEGRPINIEGAHVAKTNDHNIGVMCMGNFEFNRPTAPQLQSLDTIVADLMRRYRVPINNVVTHKELASTECPGDNLQRYMMTTRRRNGRMASMA